MSENSIQIKGGKENNLNNINLTINHNTFTVLTGVSGSGKTSLAFDTLYAEGQRRYVESLSSYARLFLGRMKKPKCDFISGLPPAIAIEQKVISRNPRSTVGTSTEIYDYLRVLYARIGKTYSPISGNIVKRHTVEDVVEFILSQPEDSKVLILSPINNFPTAKELTNHLQSKQSQGFSRLYYDGTIERIEDYIQTKLTSKHTTDTSNLYLLIDRVKSSKDNDNVSRIYESVESAFYEGSKECNIYVDTTSVMKHFSSRFELDGQEFEEPTEQMFSFNSPAGACPSCEGFGNVIGIDEKLVIPNVTLSVYNGCVQCWHGEKMQMWKDEFCRRAAKDNFPIFTPYYELSQEHKDWLWHGLPSESNSDIHDKICLDSFFKMLDENQYKIQYRVMKSRYRGKTICPECHGKRLKRETELVKISGKNIQELVGMPIAELLKWFENLQLSETDLHIGKRAISEICNRLKYLCDVGLGYLSLNRQSTTLSGGESQRINLTTCLGSSLVGSLYILDEPSIGLHSRDTERLIKVIRDLRDQDNTVVVVEHDEDIMRAADEIIDIGPKAGRNGGNVVFQGNIRKLTKTTIKKYPESQTLQYLIGKESIPLPSSRREWNRAITINGARMNNLKDIDAVFPLNILTVVTGVSGSGKSTLVKGILYPALKRYLDEVCEPPGEYSKLSGDLDAIQHIELVDQNPIGKSSRSNPVTYIKAFDAIRNLFADQQLSRQMGFAAQHFSFNTDGGRCDECKGSGEIVVEMQFMADLKLECEVCHGKRFKKEILDVKFADKNIHDILQMTVDEAIDFFTTNNQSAIAKKLKPLQDVGLGYVSLGQSSSSLSGGENQRVKLAYHIGQERMQPTLFIFDEPTTGLHFADIKCLLEAFDELIKNRHSIIVIEHNLEVIKSADYIIDLGPEAGDGGGYIVAHGTPEEIVDVNKGYTAQYLKDKIK